MYPDESGRVLIHPEDGARRGISDGDSVYLYNFRGRLKRRALVCEDTQPGLLVAEGIYWPLADEDGGVNDLTSQQCSDIGGGAIFHEARVEIVPADWRQRLCSRTELRCTQEHKKLNTMEK